MNGLHIEKASAFANFDLNLLSAFDAIFTEGSVTSAAKKMGVTQSAMSHTLRRLREALEDPLLVRTSKGLAPTPRAQALIVPIRSALTTVRRALSEPGIFDPKTTQRRFNVAAPDLFAAIALPALLQELGGGASIALTAAAGPTLNPDLETGALDLAVVAKPLANSNGEFPVPGGTGLFQKLLLKDDFVCFVRQEHPAFEKDASRLPLKTFVSMDHVLVAPTGERGGLMDTLLAELNEARRVALTLPSFLAAVPIVAQSNLVLTAPRSLARALSPVASLRMLQAPLKKTQHGVYLTWHERYTHDPGHQWFREAIAKVSAAEPSLIGVVGQELE